MAWHSSRYSQRHQEQQLGSDLNQMLSRLPYNRESLAFMFHSSMKNLQDSIVGITVPHGVSNHNEGKSRATLCQAMDNIYRVSVADLFFFNDRGDPSDDTTCLLMQQYNTSDNTFEQAVERIKHTRNSNKSPRVNTLKEAKIVFLHTPANHQKRILCLNHMACPSHSYHIYSFRR